MKRPSDTKNETLPKVERIATSPNSSFIYKENIKYIDNIFGDSSTITIVDLQCRLINDDVIKHLSELLKKNTKVTQLNLFGNDINNNGVESLIESLKNNHVINSIDLGANKVGNIGARLLADFLKQKRSITSINLDLNPISESGATHLLQAIKENQSIINFSINYHDISSQLSLNIKSTINDNLVKAKAIKDTLLPLSKPESVEMTEKFDKNFFQELNLRYSAVLSLLITDLGDAKAKLVMKIVDESWKKFVEPLTTEYKDKASMQTPQPWQQESSSAAKASPDSHQNRLMLSSKTDFKSNSFAK